MNAQDIDYEIIEENSVDKYYTQFCNIIFHLGLNPYEISLYLAIKRTIGKNGKCFKSVRKLAEETGMGKTKVSETIKSLQRKHDLLRQKPLIKVLTKTKKEGGGNLIYITNIMPDNMLFFESKEVSVERTSCPPDGQAVRVANEGGTPSQIIYIKKEPLRKSSEISLEISKYLFDKMLISHPKRKPPNFEKWAEHIELMLKQDGRTAEEIKTMIDWIFSDSFWSTVILSTQKLRNQYDDLYPKMLSRKKKQPEEDNPKKKADLIKSNTLYAKHISKTYTNNDPKKWLKIWLSDYSIVFQTRDKPSVSIDYDQNGFKDQVDSHLRKLGVL